MKGIKTSSVKVRFFSWEYLPLIILLLTTLYLLVFQGITTIWSLGVSTTNKTIGGNSKFIGLGNYIRLLGNGSYRGAMWFTAIYAFLTVAIKLVLGFVMAIALNKPIRGRAVIRALMFLPWALPTLTSVLSWRWMLGDVGGIINHLLMISNIIDSPIGWLGDPNLARWSVMMVNVWRGTPFFGISILAALQAIPNELYEVGDIEGANSFQKFRFITLPQTMGVVLLVTLISTIWTLGDFSVIWLMTRGGPANSTHVFSTLSYITAFQNLQLARGVAISMSILPFSIILLVVIMKQIFKK
ncbi:MAG: sugar ABC transporter permease [Sphaerochaeta sp.]|jgi:multiple sugar transport system permease protein|nr:sugar ABC transporter permease [Sphaerochaeta sp.]PKL25966.1 MAG: sugar ABC transporter permease [Spirochaetae bacterium HGW-Spirochaetae-2]PKM75855.1 MAG: sugar ABC transporter permease [Firmicutes bacterium HGW-Firmicutes-15]